MIAVLDNSKNIRSNIGEDSFLDNFLITPKLMKKKTLSIIRNPRKNVDFILRLSEKKFNKWKKLWPWLKRNQIPGLE